MVSREDVQYVAHLSRIHLEEREIQALTKDLEGILSYIDTLKKVDVSLVAPTSHVLPLKNVFRADTLRPSLTQGQAIDIAVAQADGAFTVPQIIE